ncbi:MAG: NUDIX hydrolase [Actinomycetota bacterium]
MGTGDGNGWVECRCGQRHWGRFGAAGLLLLRAGDDSCLEVLLQLRAEWTHQGGTWGLPGGARDSHEKPADSALREAWEETGVPPEAVDVLSTHVSADHGDWRYTVVIGRPRRLVDPRAANAESSAVRWVPDHEVPALPLHPGLARSWPDLSAAARRVEG